MEPRLRAHNTWYVILPHRAVAEYHLVHSDLKGGVETTMRLLNGIIANTILYPRQNEQFATRIGAYGEHARPTVYCCRDPLVCCPMCRYLHL
jgi:hypothetical protein